MKFARYLASHRIDEWRTGYVDYRQLKKQIGKAEDELLELDDQKEGGGGVARKPQIPRRQTTDSIQEPVHEAEDYRAHEMDLERGDGAADSDDADDERVTSPVPMSKSPDTYDHALEGSSVPKDENVKTTALERPSSLRRLSGLSASSREHSDETTKSGTKLVPKPGVSRKSSRPRLRSNADLFKPSFNRIKSSDERQTLRKWRFGLSPEDSIDTVIERVPPQSKKFFKLVDKELVKVSSFWEDRMDQALKRYDELSHQWKELSDHKKEYQASQNAELHAPKALKSVLPKHAHLIPGSGLVRRTFARAKSPEPASPGEANEADHPDIQQKAAKMAREDSNAKATAAALRHGRPEEYTHARSKLKLATFEYYRYLGMLKSYRVLNRTGFAKGVKKFEKVTSIPCGQQYKPKIEDSDFVSSPDLDELIRKTEDAFASVFEHGNRKKALERLRDFGKKQHHHFAAWRSGLLMGASIPLMVEGLVISWRSRTREEIPYWGALLQLFGACYLPVFFALAFFLNLATWHRGRINYVLIFELDVRNKLDYHQFLEIPATLLFVLSLFFWAAFSNFWPDHISPSSYPLAWLVFTLVVLLCPLNVFYASSRWWMARSMARVFSSGIVAVRFRDFFLGDELNSIYYSIYNLGFLYCTYSHGWPNDVQSICSTNKTWTTAVLASLPPFFRLGQSIRRYIDSDGLTLHLLNAGKYSATIVYFFFYFNWRIDMTRSGSSDDWRFALFIVFAALNSVYVAAWDILLDWSLGKRNPKHPFLRAELGYFKDNWWLYYVFSVVNVILRFSWVIYLAPHPSASVQSYIIALIEASRRIMWNTFRVEAEHVGNKDGYRVTRDVSLPYVTASSPEASGQTSPGVGPEDEDDPSLPINKRIFAALHRTHVSILKNLEPVIDAIVVRTGWFREGWSKRRIGKKDKYDEGEDAPGDGDTLDDREGGGSSQSQGENRGDRPRKGSESLTANKQQQRAMRRRRKRRNTLTDAGESTSSDDILSSDERKDVTPIGDDDVEERDFEDEDEKREGRELDPKPRKSMRHLSSDEEDDDEDAGESGVKDPHKDTADEEMKEEMRDADRMRTFFPEA
ncbi:Syg1p [Sporobolomyces salmoneus]|uniref:Syg1p n=1 Tax=Sporobolomyces salmoneus TaxID=183962 RepID=UPI0031795F9C